MSAQTFNHPDLASISSFGPARATVSGMPLNAEELAQTHAFWRACNYLALGMIYLQDNPLLREPLKPEHIKNRLLGHWGASPALSFVYTHMNRAIRKHDLDAIFLAGPGHGAPGVLGPVYLEGSYSDIYPDKSLDEDGLQAFFKQFSFPGGIGSHCTPETPGSIHEGGELGYVLSHACGAAFDNPELIVTAVVGDGEAETGPLATSWHINKFLNPARDGAVLPVLNLNGYKINNPTLLARIGHEELSKLFEGYGWTPLFVEGSDPETLHQAMAATVDHAVEQIRAIQRAARTTLADDRPAHAQGLDRAGGNQRPPGRGLLARAPGADGGCQDPSRPPPVAGILAEILPARGAVRRGRRPGGRHPAIRPHRFTPHGLQPACQWRTPEKSPEDARFP